MKDADVGHCAFERTPTQSLRVRMEYQHSLLDFLPPAWTVLDLLRNSSTSLCLKPEGFGGFFFLLSQSQSKGWNSTYSENLRFTGEGASSLCRRVL